MIAFDVRAPESAAREVLALRHLTNETSRYNTMSKTLISEMGKVGMRATQIHSALRTVARAPFTCASIL